jgi:hypothetical protein
MIARLIDWLWRLLAHAGPQASESIDHNEPDGNDAVHQKEVDGLSK